MSTQEPQSDANLGISFNPQSVPEEAQETHESATRGMNASHLSNQGDVFDVGRAFTNTHGETGTIVSDRKHHRPSVGESFKNAFSEWWGMAQKNVSRTKEALTYHSEETPEVAKAETRAGVIKEAMQGSSIAPKDDHHIVVEKVRTLKSDTVKVTGGPTITIKDAPATPTTAAWSHTKEAPRSSTIPQRTPRQAGGTPDVRTATIAPVVERRIKKNISEFVPHRTEVPRAPTPQPTQKKPAVQIGYMNIPDTVPEQTRQMPSPVAVPAPVTPHNEVRVAKREPVLVQHEHVPAPVPTPPVREPMEQTEYGHDAVRHVQPTASFSDVPHADAPVFHGVSALPERAMPENIQEDTPRDPEASPSLRFFLQPRILFAGAGAIGVVLAFVFTIVFVVLRDDAPTPVQSTLTIPSFFKTERQTSIALEADPHSFLTTLRDELLRARETTTQFYPVIVDNESVSRVATANEFFTFIGARVESTFLGSLEDAFMVGGIASAQNTPFIIIRSYSFDALFAGLLNWETRMFADLAPLFTGEVTSSRFVDTIVNNKPARVLYDTLGNEVLIYSFVNQNTVIITSERTALSAVIERL